MTGKHAPTKHIEEPKLCGVVVTQLPEDGAKQQANAHSEEKPHSIVLWRPAAQNALKTGPFPLERQLKVCAAQDDPHIATAKAA